MRLHFQTGCSSDHVFTTPLNNTEHSLGIREMARYVTHFTYTNGKADKACGSFMETAVWGLEVEMSRVIQQMTYMANSFQLVVSKLPRGFHLLLSFTSWHSEGHTKLLSMEVSQLLYIKWWNMESSHGDKKTLKHSCDYRTKGFKCNIPQAGVAKNLMRW